MSFQACTNERQFGVELKGIDASVPLPTEALRFVSNALNEYSVVYMRDQKISPEQLAVFGRLFGPLKVINANRFFVPGFTDLHIISNVKDDQGNYIGHSDAGLFWHSDMGYNEKPDLYSFLYALEIPIQDGKPLGNTNFCSTIAAYNALPEDMKKKLATLKALNSFERLTELKRAKGQLRRGEITEHERKLGISAVHPVVRTHPVTGKKALYVSEGHTVGIIDMPENESAKLLEGLYAHMTQPRFIYSHQWKVGDLLIWDNAATLHKADFDYALPQRRLLHRATIKGGIPV